MPSSVSQEQRVAWGRKGGLSGAANHSPQQRRLSATNAANARAAKYGHEELQRMYAGFLRKRLGRMLPEEARAFQQSAGAARMRVLSPENRSALARRAITLRWARIHYAKNPAPADRVLAFVADFIAAKHYSPATREIYRALHHNPKTLEKLLEMLEAVGKIKREPWNRGIVLCIGTVESPPAVDDSAAREAEAPIEVEVVTPRVTRKCYDCDNPAVEGKTRCPRHLARARALRSMRQE
jgi:hypothetical protein